MLRNAKEIIESAMKSLDPYKDQAKWGFLNNVLMGTVPEAQIDHTQDDLLLATLHRIKLFKEYNELLNDEVQSTQFAMQIATWINSVHAARSATSL
jgi:hypothetical protein